MAQVGMHEAKTKLSQLVQRAEAGKDIIIARSGKPGLRRWSCGRGLKIHGRRSVHARSPEPRPGTRACLSRMPSCTRHSALGTRSRRRTLLDWASAHNRSGDPDYDFVWTLAELALAEGGDYTDVDRRVAAYLEELPGLVDVLAQAERLAVSHDGMADLSRWDLAGQLRRFRSRRWPEHIGAWWELYLFRLFRSLGFEVEVHPALPGVTTRPDFRVHRRDGSFLVEARHVAAGIRCGRREVGRDDWITAPLDELAHPNFMVGVRILERAPQRPRRAAVTIGVLDWLDGLDPDEVLVRPVQDRPLFQGQAGGWRFELKALPVNVKARGREGRRLVGLYPGSGGYDNTTAALRAALKEKASKYGRPNAHSCLRPSSHQVTSTPRTSLARCSEPRRSRCRAKIWNTSASSGDAMASGSPAMASEELGFPLC